MGAWEVSRKGWTGAVEVGWWGKCVGTIVADGAAEGLEEGVDPSGMDMFVVFVWCAGGMDGLVGW